MDWNNPGGILNSQFVFSITAEVIEYHSNNYKKALSYSGLHT